MSQLELLTCLRSNAPSIFESEADYIHIPPLSFNSPALGTLPCSGVLSINMSNQSFPGSSSLLRPLWCKLTMRGPLLHLREREQSMVPRAKA